MIYVIRYDGLYFLNKNQEEKKVNEVLENDC